MAVVITEDEFRELIKELISGIYYLKVSDGYIPGTLSYISSSSAIYHHLDTPWTSSDFQAIMAREIYPFLVENPENVTFTFGWDSKLITPEDLDAIYEQLEDGYLNKIILSGMTATQIAIECSLTPNDTELIKEDNARLVAKSGRRPWTIWGECNINNVYNLIRDN